MFMLHVNLIKQTDAKLLCDGTQLFDRINDLLRKGRGTGIEHDRVGCDGTTHSLGVSSEVSLGRDTDHVHPKILHNNNHNMH